MLQRLRGDHAPRYIPEDVQAAVMNLGRAAQLLVGRRDVPVGRRRRGCVPARVRLAFLSGAALQAALVPVKRDLPLVPFGSRLLVASASRSTPNKARRRLQSCIDFHDLDAPYHGQRNPPIAAP